MDKLSLQQQVLDHLADTLRQAEHAAQVAHETATHEENIAENKYDTLGLEAAYLATGQARRAEAIRRAIALWRQFRPRAHDAGQGIALGFRILALEHPSQGEHGEGEQEHGPIGHDPVPGGTNTGNHGGRRYGCISFWHLAPIVQGPGSPGHRGFP